MLKAFLPACHTYTRTHACTHSLTNTGCIGSIPKEGKSDKLFFFPSFSVELCESFAPSPLNRSTLTVCFTGQGCEVLCFNCEFGPQVYTLMRCYAFFLASRAHTFAFLPVLPFPCWAACHGREVRRHVILQWCVERIQPGVPRHRMTTNQTSVAGFQQHEKYMDPSARLEMASYTV